ncbi:MAG: hypothetical protein CL561_02800 [Alphaproteobacteria bacterium]|nr:hypothetical protein [Alphaproteobacteria bacterium]|tara:strand:- start:713103 stop:714437 length:1335 start_codon:yes stop_codon:yes gene_type:complete
MTPAARIKASIEIFNTIEKSIVPMDSVVGDYMRGRKYIGSKDRRYIVGFCYDAMRAYAKLRWWLEKVGLEVDGRTIVMAALALLETRDAAYIDVIFNGDKYSPETLDDAEKAALNNLVGQDLVHADMAEHVQLEIPEKYYDALKGLHGDDLADEMHAYMGEAALDLRVNLMRIARDDALASLKKEDIAAKPHQYSPWGIRLKQKTFLTTTKSYKKQFIDIQDEGSQLIAYACNPQPSMQVLDFCAGAGGKTLGLAAAMNCKGRIVAMDIDSRRLAKAKPRFKRAAVSDIIETRGLEESKNRKWLRRQKETFDVTLIDVPCSGTGTWRRNPDMRWHHYGPTLDELIQTQSEILDRVSHTVKIGGRLVYATCSILPQENEEQIAAFLARNPDYKVLPLAQAWPDKDNIPCSGDYMRLSPHQHGTDGFFAAVLERVSADHIQEQDNS